MKVSEHLAAFHKAAHQHHSEMIDAHEAALKKGAMDQHTAFHKAAIDSHSAMQAYHSGAIEDCEKATRDALAKAGDRIVPDFAGGVVPLRPGIQPVLRAGQRELPGQGGRPNVDPEFEHLVKISDDE